MCAPPSICTLVDRPCALSCRRRNRLHTHAGARWSVVFYAAASENSGSLILVPKHAPSATDHELTPEECMYLRAVPGTAGIHNPNATREKDGTSGVCHYLEVPPVPGSIVVFPAWLLHAVMPGSSEADDSCEPRVSVAFNVGDASVSPS